MNIDEIEQLLPGEFRSGNCIPVERVTIKRDRMIEILSDAIEQDRQRRGEPFAHPDFDFLEGLVDHFTYLEILATAEKIGAANKNAAHVLSPPRHAPSSFVNAAGIKASDNYATVIHKLDVAFHDAVTFNGAANNVASNPGSVDLSQSTDHPPGNLKPYSLDKDPAGIRALVADAIRGAIAFGAQGVNPPPHGHWLTEFWEAGKPWSPDCDTIYAAPQQKAQQEKP